MNPGTAILRRARALAALALLLPAATALSARAAEVFDAASFPTIVFKSTKIAPGAGPNRFEVTGDLTIRGVTRPVVVAVELMGFGETPMGFRGGFHATTTINRQDFGVKWNRTLDTGGTILGNEVTIDFPIEVVKRAK
jgi:polyisoprenoid-binding protein YceI